MMIKKFEWLKRGKIFETKRNFDWTQSHTALPTPILLDDKTIRIFYSTRDFEKRSRLSFVDVDADNPSNILYIHGEPLMGLGDIGTFDDCGMTASHVIPMNNKFYFFYNGYNRAEPARYRISIGLAESDNKCKKFNRIYNGPIMDRTPLEPYGVATPFIIKEKELYKMWYTSFVKWVIINGDAEPFYQISYAESKDCINWVSSGMACIKLDDNEGGIVRPTVVKIDNIYYMWFSVRKNTGYRDDSGESYRIGFATSKDGVAWDRDDAGAGISTSEEGWDSFMTAYPFVLRVKRNYYMFYNGNGFGQSGFGYAELKEIG